MCDVLDPMTHWKPYDVRGTETEVGRAVPNDGDGERSMPDPRRQVAGRHRQPMFQDWPLFEVPAGPTRRQVRGCDLRPGASGTQGRHRAPGHAARPGRLGARHRRVTGSVVGLVLAVVPARPGHADAPGRRRAAGVDGAHGRFTRRDDQARALRGLRLGGGPWAPEGAGEPRRCRAEATGRDAAVRDGDAGDGLRRLGDEQRQGARQ